jgi:hypothetical protein
MNEGDRDEFYEEIKIKMLGKKLKNKTITLKDPTKSQKEILDNYRLYSVVIDFIPTPTNNSPSGSSRNGDTSTVTVTVRGKNLAEALFGDVVQQIREQIPDNKFLDTLVERFLTEFNEEKKA